MKINFLLALFFIVVLYACKKDADIPEATPYPAPAVAFFKCQVIDSVTGLAVPNAPVYIGPIHATLSAFPETARSNGIYTGQLSWGGRIGLHRPADSTEYDVQVVTSNKAGFIHFKAGFLVVNDTLNLPTLYIKPIGYLKLHVKDTSGTSVNSVGLNVDYALSTQSIFGFSNNTTGHPVDTMFMLNAHPDRSVQLTWLYTKSSISYTNSQNVFVQSADTAAVSIFY